MYKLIMSLGVIVAGILCGQTIKRSQKNKPQEVVAKTTKKMATLKNVMFLGFNPIVMFGAYWAADLRTTSMLSLPFIGMAILACCGSLAYLASRLFKHNNQERSAMFACGTFSNLGIVGGLVALVFLGEEGFVVASLYFLFESFYNFLIAYPIVKTIGEGKNGEKTSLLKIFKDPSIIIYVSCIIVGLILNLSPLERPQIMGDFNTVMVPVISFLLTLSISYRMELQKIGNSIKEGLACIGIKYICSPIIALSLAYLCGLQHIDNGFVIKVVFIMSTTPCGFNSIIVPTLYKADKDVANSVWIMNMAMLVLIIPIQYVVCLVL